MESETTIKPVYTAGIFIDYENLLLSFMNTYNVSPLDAAVRTSRAISEITQYLKNNNIKITINEAFADWRDYRGAVRVLTKQGVKTIQVYALPHKSSADIELSLRIFDTIAFGSEYLDVYVILGGDRDYLPILRRISEHGRGALIVGLNKTLSHWLIKEVGPSNCVLIDPDTGNLNFKCSS